MSLSQYTFKTEDAQKYGVEEAVILYHIRYWVATNAANNKHNYDGRHWTYNSASSLAELFPFWKRLKCWRLIDSLKAQGAILVGNYNKRGYDRTNWYTVNDDSSISQKQPTEDDENQQTMFQKRTNNGSNLNQQVFKSEQGMFKSEQPIPITNYNYPNTILITPPGVPVGEEKREIKAQLRKEIFVPEWKHKPSPWYQHYLKSSHNEQTFNSLPELARETLWRQTSVWEKLSRSEAKDLFLAELCSLRPKPSVRLPQDINLSDL